MDVWEYFGQKEREYRELSLVPDFGFESLFAEEAGSSGTRGRIFGNFRLSANDDVDAFLAVHETAVVRRNHIHREEYGYFLIIDGVEIGGWERDLSHDPPVHRHTKRHAARIETSPISFREFAEWAWQEVTRHVETDFAD